MLKVFVIFAFAAMASFASAEVPSECAKCMSSCPHLTKDLKPCDRGCPDVCSKAQAAEFKKQQADKLKIGSCYECMSSCPHLTKDLKPCDRGCPEVCDVNGLREAFVKANGRAKECMEASGAGASGGESSVR